MDLTVELNNHVLNIRAAVIILHNNKFLVHRNVNETYNALIGGRVKAGESSEETIKREIKEELGKDVEVTGYCTTIENFFNLKDKEYHEILFVHFAEFVEEEDKKIEYTLKNIEGREYLEYRWIDLDEIDNCVIKPDAIKNVLKNKSFPCHVINDDR